ncbi:hypothetical protein HZA97_03415 [Candidatus Woesearchaeota archaeon]|nr:hypothetical protein [Candidatus Woesearchaeota archaeon]
MSENSSNEAKAVLEVLSANDVSYALIRNYDFLLGKNPGKDIDVVINLGDAEKIKDLMIQKGFFPQKICPYSAHLGFYKFISADFKLLKFHFHIGGIAGRYSPYLSASEVLKKKRLFKGFPVISNEDLLISLIFHSNLSKGKGKEKYLLSVESILDQDFDKKYIRSTLEKKFGFQNGQDILRALYSRDFEKLDLLRNKINRSFFFKSFFSFCLTRMLCAFWKMKVLILGAPLVSFIGMDGAGKTTLTKEIKQVLEENKIKADLIYSGRGKKNLLPIQKIGKPYKKLEGYFNLSSTFLKIIHTFASVFFFLDLLIRYLFVIYPARVRNDIVLTDRYGSDMLLMKNVPMFLKNIYFSILPKPSLVFYVYTEINILHQRKPNHPFEDLQRQEKLFEEINRKINPIKIKNDDLKESKRLILSEMFNRIQI